MLEGLEEYAEKAETAERSEKLKRQRWPRPCSICQSRKVKCGRATPCTNCQRRGAEHLCIPEADRPAGQKRKRRKINGNAAVADLVVESSTPIATAPDPPSEPIWSASEVENGQPPDTFESLDQVCVKALSKPQMHIRPQPKWNHLVLPNINTSRALVAYDRVWNSWVHNALYYARFEKEHDTFLIMRQSGKPITSMESSWLALYFAVLAASLMSMSEEQADKLELPLADHPTLSRRWYDAALFCLDDAEYMRKPSVRTVQTVAILGLCFDNVGDHDLGQTMWATAIRIGLKLSLNHPDKMAAPLPMPVEQCIRLWWSIVIHDWVPVPGYTPLVPERETRCSLPGSLPDSEDLTVAYGGHTISSIRFQSFMARAAIFYNDFYCSLYKDTMTKNEVVRQADERLRQLVARLPEYLKPGSSAQDASVTKLESEHPWVRWQRVRVSLTYLTHRLSIYSVLESNWRDQPNDFNWARSMCLQAACDITSVDMNWDIPKFYRRHWFYSMSLLKAAYVITREASQIPSGMDWKATVGGCIAHLEETRAWNDFAGSAAQTIRQLAISALRKPQEQS